MIMTYGEYIKIVPKETVEFVDLVLKMFDAYILNDVDIYVSDIADIKHKDSKIFALLLFAKCHCCINDGTRVLLDKCDLKKEFINFVDIKQIKEKKINYTDVFNKFSSIFCPFYFYENYLYLTSDRILLEIFKKDKFHKNEVSSLVSNSSWEDVMNGYYKKYVNHLQEKIKNEIEAKFYKDLSYELIEYLETASKIFKYLEQNKYENNTDKYDMSIIKTNDDMVLASLILSICNTNNKVSTFFESINIEKRKCENYLLFGKNHYFHVPPSSGTILKEYFEKYLSDGINKDIERGNLKIENIIGNIFDRNFTNSLVLERLLYYCGVSITDFSDFENKLQDFEKIYESIKKQKEIEKFFGEISQETIEFVEFVSKVHQIIKNNFDNGKIAKKYINNEFDISVLSFFISSYFFPNDFICYFKNNGITEEQIFNKLGISITKDEILKMESDINIILNNYEDFIFEYTIDRKQVSINTVLYSLGNCDENESNCILTLVKDINPNLRITNNFQNLIIDYNSNQENIRKYKLEQEFFGDMNQDCVNYIKEVSQVYQSLENSNKTLQFSRDDLIEIAIYYQAINYNQEDLRFKFLRSLKSESIGERLNIFDKIDSYDANIDIIYNYFGKYVFGSKNKDKKKSEITIKDIYTNIFNKDMNNSLALYKFLADIGFDCNRFNNFEDSFLEFEKNEHISAVKESFNCTSHGIYFENLSKIYNHLFNMSKDKKLIYDVNKDLDYIKDASRLLEFLLELLKLNGRSNDKYLSLLNKRGITVDNYLKYINISLDDFNNYQNQEINYLTIYENFGEYKEYSNCDCLCGMLAENLFKQNNNKYRYENFIKYLGQSPEIIAKEMETGEEVVVPLSKEEQLNYLTTMPINKLDYGLNSIASFGMELADYSIIIANEFVNIAMQDSDNNNRVLDIKKEIRKLTKKRIIFSGKKSVSERIAYNKEILDNLNDILKENETSMIEVIAHFGYLKKLIAIYVYRLNSYIDELNSNIANFDSLVKNNKQNILEILDNETLRQTLYGKLNDYKKSLVISLQQYKKINSLLNNYLINLSKTSTARNTTIPNLYIELSIRDSILLGKDSVSDLNDINNLLKSIVKTNNKLLDRSIFRGRKNSINIKDLSGEIRKVLEAENLITQDNTGEIDINKSLVKKTDI